MSTRCDFNANFKIHFSSTVRSYEACHLPLERYFQGLHDDVAFICIFLDFDHLFLNFIEGIILAIIFAFKGLNIFATPLTKFLGLLGILLNCYHML